MDNIVLLFNVNSWYKTYHTVILKPIFTICSSYTHVSATILKKGKIASCSNVFTKQYNWSITVLLYLYLIYIFRNLFFSSHFSRNYVYVQFLHDITLCLLRQKEYSVLERKILCLRTVANLNICLFQCLQPKLFLLISS
jgi:hypothetical protein